MTLDIYVEKVFQRVSRGNPERTVGIDRKSIEAGVSEALRELAERVAAGNEPQRLRKTFDIAMVGGAADLAPHQDLVVASLPEAYIVIDGVEGEALQYQAERRNLDLPPSSEFTYFYPDDEAIIVRDGTAAVPADGTLKVTAGRIPSLADLPTSLNSLLIKVGVEMAQGSVGP